VPGRLRLTGEEGRHAGRVVRLRPGAELLLVDGFGRSAIAVVERVAAGSVDLQLLREGARERPAPLELALPWLRSPSRVDWAIEKATELGIRAVHLFPTARTLKRGAAKLEARQRRWREVARAAMKQAGRAWWPAVEIHATFDGLLAASASETAWVVADAAGAPAASSAAPWREGGRVMLLVGPEGGFAPAERAAIERCLPMRLRLAGHRLRSETAAVALAAWAIGGGLAIGEAGSGEGGAEKES
jgi:16S rRNA (uracil1498-N3)-methyltransferase